MAKTVIHTLYGRGEILTQDERYLTVRFAREEIGEKRFLYPIAFESHLRYEDSASQTEVEQALETLHHREAEAVAAKEAEREEKRLRALEEAKQKKKEQTTARQRSKKKAEITEKAE